MTGWFVVFPLVVIGAAAVAAFVFMRLSTLRITSAGVEIRNYPQAPRVIPLAQTDRFIPSARVGAFASFRPGTAVLVLVDGSRVPTRALSEPEAGYGIEALNARLAALRSGE